MLCPACYGDPATLAACATCHGTGRATTMPLCREPWNEVVPGLFQGGHDVRPVSATACVVGTEFDLVVSLATRPGYGPAEGVPHRVLRMADAGIDAPLAGRLEDLAVEIADAVRAGRRVLVRCSGGLNRSGLLTALALRHLGHDTTAAIDAVRAARGPWALTNPGFVRHLQTLG